MILARCLLLVNIVAPQNQVLSVFMVFCAETLKACSEEAQPLLGKGHWGSLVFSTWQPQVVFVSFFFHLVKKKKKLCWCGRRESQEGRRFLWPTSSSVLGLAGNLGWYHRASLHSLVEYLFQAYQQTLQCRPFVYISRVSYWGLIYYSPQSVIDAHRLLCSKCFTNTVSCLFFQLCMASNVLLPVQWRGNKILEGERRVHCCQRP